MRTKRFLLGIVVLAVCFVSSHAATPTPYSPFNHSVSISIAPASHSVNKSRNQNIFQRVTHSIFKKKINKWIGKKIDKQKKRRLGRLSLFFGLASLALLIFSVGIWFALPAAIAGLIFGLKSVKDNSNAEGIIGLIASGITLSVFLIVAIVLISLGLTAF